MNIVASCFSRKIKRQFMYSCVISLFVTSKSVHISMDVIVADARIVWLVIVGAAYVESSSSMWS